MAGLTPSHIVRMVNGSPRQAAVIHFENRGRTAAMPGTVIIWDARSGHPAHTLRDHKHLVRQVSFSPNGAPSRVGEP